MGSWRVETGTPVDTGDLVFQGPIASPPKVGARTWTFPAEPFLYLDGSLTPILLADVPPGFAFDDPWGSNYSSDVLSGATSSVRMQIFELGVDVTLTNLGHLGPLSGTGITAAVMADLVSSTIVSTGHAHAIANPAVSTSGGEIEITGTYTITPPQNLSPNINAGQDQFVAPPLPAIITLVGTFENAPPAGATITYLWEFVSGPTGASAPAISDPTNLTTDVTMAENLIGSYVFRLTSSGDINYSVPSSSDLVSIIIPIPGPPRITNISATVTP